MLTPGPCVICGAANAALYLKPIRNPNPRIMTNGQFGHAGPICAGHSPEEMASAVFLHNTRLALLRPQREIELPHGAGTYRLVDAVSAPEMEPTDEMGPPPEFEAPPAGQESDPETMTPAQVRMAAARAKRHQKAA